MDLIGAMVNHKVVRGLLAYRNTPDQMTNRSPAQVLYGQQLCEFLLVIQKKLRLCDKWHLLRDNRGRVLARVQTMVGLFPKSWDNTGTVVEVGIYDQFVVKLYRSGRLVTRIRQVFLMKRDQRLLGMITGQADNLR